MLVGLIKRLVVLINRLIILINSLISFFNRVIMLINGLTEFIDRLVIRLNDLILTLVFLWLSYFIPWSSKDQCDQGAAIARNNLWNYVDQGNNIQSADDIFIALTSTKMQTIKFFSAEFDQTMWLKGKKMKRKKR